MEFFTVHVAEWSGMVRHSVTRDYNPRLVVDELKQLIDDEVLNKGLSVPVASYIINEDEIDEITLQGPQLMIRGQPVSVRVLTVVSTIRYPI